MILPEPTLMPDGTENPEFWMNSQLQQIFFASQNLSLTSRDGAIQQGDKAGNLSAVFVVFTSNGTANTEDSVTHTLGRIPRGYIPVSQNKSAVLYESGTAFTSSKIYLKSTAVSVAWIVLVF